MFLAPGITRSVWTVRRDWWLPFLQRRRGKRACWSRRVRAADDPGLGTCPRPNATSSCYAVFGATRATSVPLANARPVRDTSCAYCIFARHFRHGSPVLHGEKNRPSSSLRDVDRLEGRPLLKCRGFPKGRRNPDLKPRSSRDVEWSRSRPRAASRLQHARSLR